MERLWSLLLLIGYCNFLLIFFVNASDHNHGWNHDLITPLLIPQKDQSDVRWMFPLQGQHQGSPLTLPHNDKSKFLKTGTTIIGICINGDDVENNDFCILAADTRATAGSLVADTRAAKLHPLSRTCFAAGAGTSADLEHITAECQATMKLRQFEQIAGNYGEMSDISALQICRHLSLRLYEMGGACQANLIVGGLHQKKAVLRAIHPHGSMDELQFAALGSGGLAAMSVLENRYRPDLSLGQATQLAVDAIQAGIQNDLGSGSQVDIVIVHANGKVDYRRGIVPEESLSELPPLPEEMVPKDGEEQASGVNGFGNLPFRIRSRRTVLTTQERDRESEENLWKDVLQR